MLPKSPSVKSPKGLSIISIVAAIAILSFIIYYLTAYRTVTWWNSGEYSLAAAILGVAHPPGCLLGTILGWIVVKLTVCNSIAYALNLFAGMIAALTAVIVGLISAYYLRKGRSSIDFPPGRRELFAVSFGAIVGALTMAFGETFWIYATKFTPYIFTVLFTALILWAMIKWAGAGSKAHIWLFVVTILFGLDFSVHRTNLLMAPGLIIWMLIINPRTFLSLRTWVFGALGLGLGLSFHMLLIPIAAAKPFLNGGDPSSWSGFWDYVTLQQLGGGFLVKFFPRNAPFWDVQVMDYLRAFSANFFSWNGIIREVGLLPGIFGIAGLIGIWRRNRRLALGMIVLFLLTSVLAILYFNIPANYFRSLFRHYMPSFVIFSVWIAYGVGSLLLAAVNWHKRRQWLVYYEAAFLLILMPGYQIANNFDRLDGSKNYFTQDYALNMIKHLPENSILITFGDNDTFPVWYYQIVEGIRPDVTVLNTSLLNTQWFLRQMLAYDPDLPLGITPDEIDGMTPLAWQDTTIVLPIEGAPADYGLAEGVELPDSMYLNVPPTINDQYLLISDQLLLSLIQDNNWIRPIYLSSAGGVPWLQPYCQFEGVVNRLTPVENPPFNTKVLSDNLLHNYSYRGYADPEVPIDPTTRTMAGNYLIGHVMCAHAAQMSGDKELLEEIKAHAVEVMPLDRLRPLPDHIEQYMARMEQMTIE